MVELGQLESQWQEFEKRKVIVVAVSVDDLEAARDVQRRFPRLEIVSDADQKLTDAAAVLHRKSAPGGGDSSAPTTFLIDGKGVVRWAFRPDRVSRRLSPAEVLEAIDQKMPAD